MRKISVLSRACILVCLITVARLQTVTLATGVRTLVTPSAFTFSGPYSHKNLQVFLIHSRKGLPGKAPLTLSEALKSEKVKVLETGNVNELSIENLSSDEVFVQSGDIVKGGNQDRVLALDLVLPPHSGEIAIAAFCVEEDRWSKRGNEDARHFSESNQVLNSKDLKIAAKSAKSQIEVWARVAESRRKLANNVESAMVSGGSVAYGGGDGTGGSGGIFTTQMPQVLPPSNERSNSIIGRQVEALNSSASLQLTLENEAVITTSDSYLKELQSVVDGKPDVVGFLFAINGKINSADVYSSHSLFVSLWERMLRAAAVEAIAEFDAKKQSGLVTSKDARAFIARAETGTARKQIIIKGTSSVLVSNRNTFLFETRTTSKRMPWIHRNYIAK